MSSITSATLPKLGEAIDALRHQMNNKKSQDMPELISSDTSDVVSLSFRLQTVPKSSCLLFEHVAIPHNIFPEDASICLLVRDPKDKAVKKVAASGVKVAKVICIRSLKKKYGNPEAKRDLCNKFDIFLAEKEILDLMPSLLGRYFYDVKKYKIPYPIKQISKESFAQVLSCTRFRQSTGPVLGVRIGRLESMTTAQILENAAAVIPAVEQYLAKKSNGIQNIETQVTNTIILPVFVSAKVPEFVPEAPKRKRKQVEEVATQDSDDSADEDGQVKDIASLSVAELKKLNEPKKPKRKSN